MTALKAKADGTVVPQVIGEMRNIGVPESFVRGTSDRYEEKNIDFVIQFMCKLRGTVQLIDPKPPEPELNTHQTTQFTDKKSNDGLVTNQSEDFSTSCRLMVVNRTQQTSASRTSRM